MRFTTATEEERDKIIKEILAKLPQAKKKIELGKRIVVTGKGGVGKTVISAVLSHLFADAGFNVLAVDEDPQMNLPFIIGLQLEVAKNIVPLNRQLDYIEEKTGARPGIGWGLFFRLNPDVSDVVDRFGVKVNEKLNLLVMGSVVQPAVGCACPENDLLQAVVNHINLREKEIIIMDTEAGLEHFGRAIAKGFHHAVIVSEPTFNSAYVMNQAVELAKKLGIPKVHLVFNKVKENEIDKVKKLISDFNNNLIQLPIYLFPYDDEISKTEPSILPVVKDGKSEFVKAVMGLFKNLLSD